MTSAALKPSRLLPRDLVSVGLVGLRTRRLRAALSAVGIAIGIASMVAVLAISESSKADLIATLDRLGTNLLTVTPGQSFLGEDSELPKTATRMIGHVGEVETAAAIASISDETVRRTGYVAKEETNGISLLAADVNLLATVGGSMRAGRFLNRATATTPAVVLGALAADRLGIGSVEGNPLVFIAGDWFAVTGIISHLTLAGDLDRAALIGFPFAKKRFKIRGTASAIFVRADPDALDTVRRLLGPTANPENPEEVQVSRPSDALAARVAAKGAFTALFLGLGAVALLVGGVGIANVMVISILERRSEIGLRRALGATRPHIRLQFLSESLVLAGLGGFAGVLLGAAVSGAYAASQGWAVVVPTSVIAAGLGAALTIGAVAGLYPAMRAARLSPTEALRTV